MAESTDVPFEQDWKLAVVALKLIEDLDGDQRWTIAWISTRKEDPSVNWQQVLQDEVDAAVGLLSIAPISVAVNDSGDSHETWVDAREINVGDQFLAAIGRVAALFGAFHEVGHIYVDGKYGAFPSAHDLEKACDRVGGWLCGRRGLGIGADETLVSTYGATILDAYRNAPLHLRVAVTLGLNSSASHPDGGSRASNVLAGWMEAMTGRPCPI